MSSRKACCIRGCTGKSRRKRGYDSLVKFYKFPDSMYGAPWKIAKRTQWINAVKNYVKNSEDWTPTKNTRICSIHFVNNAKSEHPLHPSYVPSMFSEDENISKRIQSLRRFERLQYRKSQKDLNNKGLISVSGESHSNKINDNASNIRIEQDEHADRSEPTIARPAQTETIMDDMSSDSTYLFGNRNYRDGLSTAAVQTNIPMKKTLDKMCQASISILKNNVRDFGCNPMTEINKSSC